MNLFITVLRRLTNISVLLLLLETSKVDNLFYLRLNLCQVNIIESFVELGLMLPVFDLCLAKL